MINPQESHVEHHITEGDGISNGSSSADVNVGSPSVRPTNGDSARPSIATTTISKKRSAETVEESVSNSWMLHLYFDSCL